MAISYSVAHNGGLITEEIKDRAKLYSVHADIFLQVDKDADDYQFGIVYSSFGDDPEFDGGSADVFSITLGSPIVSTILRSPTLSISSVSLNR